MEFAGYTSDTVVLNDLPDTGERSEIQLLARPVPLVGSLEVAVTSDRGTPISPAYVYASTSPLTSKVVMTDERGVATIEGLPELPLSIHARAAPWYRSALATHTIHGRTQLTMRLETNARLSVRLRTPSGAGLAVANLRVCTSCPGSWSECVAGTPEALALPWDLTETQRVAHAIVELSDGSLLEATEHELRDSEREIHLLAVPLDRTSRLLLELGDPSLGPKSAERLTRRLASLGPSALPALRFAARHPLAGEWQRGSMIDYACLQRRRALWALACTISACGVGDPEGLGLVRRAAFSWDPDLREIGLRAAALLGRR